MKDIKIITVDMDGTVLTSRNTISDGTKAAFQRAADNGIHIIPITGRSFAMRNWLNAELPMINYACVCNGASIYDMKKPERLHSELLTKDQVTAILDLVYTVKSIPYLSVIGGMSYSDARCMDKYFMNFNIPSGYINLGTRLTTDLYDFLNKKNPEVEVVFTLFETDEISKEINKLVGEIPGVNAANAFVGEGEYNSSKANKGDALLNACKLMGVSPENAMAIGDGTNDIPMFKEAGIAVCMANGIDQSKSYADIITLDHDEDGVAAVINKLIDGELKVDENKNLIM